MLSTISQGCSKRVEHKGLRVFGPQTLDHGTSENELRTLVALNVQQFGSGCQKLVVNQQMGSTFCIAAGEHPGPGHAAFAAVLSAVFAHFCAHKQQKEFAKNSSIQFSLIDHCSEKSVKPEIYLNDSLQVADKWEFSGKV